MLTDDEIEAAVEEGSQLQRRRFMGVRGQAWFPADALEYQTVIAGVRKFCEVNGLSIGSSPSAQPVVAWRFKLKGEPNLGWVLTDRKPPAESERHYDIEPLVPQEPRGELPAEGSSPSAKEMK